MDTDNKISGGARLGAQHQPQQLRMLCGWIFDHSRVP